MSQPDTWAFPIAIKAEGNATPIAYGMSLRDYFAAAALQGMLAFPGNRKLKTWAEADKSEVAAQCYAYADAMLKKREKLQ